MVFTKNPFIPKKEAPLKTIDLNKSAGILDDYAVRKNIATREGTIQKVPVNAYDIVNKTYCDSHVGQWTISGSNIYYNSGNVGIGTTTPRNQLELFKSENNSATLIGNYASGLLISNNYGFDSYSAIKFEGNSGDGTFIKSIIKGNNDHVLQFGQYNSGPGESVHMTMLNNGNVGIGTTSPQTKLDVSGDIRLPYTSKLILHETNDNNYINYNTWQTGSINGLNFITASTQRMTITNAGNVGIGTTNPTTKLHISGGALTMFNSAAPATPTNAGALFISGGALWYKGSSGTETSLAIA